jgi:predicted MFS family arabinose efflux permease
LNRNVLLLGITSLVNDVSGEMLSAVLPMLITDAGGTGKTIGLVGGAREAVSNVLKIPAGYLSDRFKKNKPFVFAGYALSCVFKLLLSFSTTLPWIAGFAVAERIGKGVRTPPRDAIISVSGKAGKSFGFHRAMDTLGGIIGSAIALVMIGFLHIQPKTVVAVSTAVSFVALPPILAVREKQAKKRATTDRCGGLPKLIGVFFLFSISNISYMFLMLFARELTGSKPVAIALYVCLNVVYASFSYTAGSISDRVERSKVLSVGYALFGVSLMLPVLSKWLIFLSFPVYGLAMSVVDTVQRAMIANLTKQERRGRVYGVMHTGTGVGTMLGNGLAGFLWDTSPELAFAFSGSVALTSALLLRGIKE